jgi:hypothetical protein
MRRQLLIVALVLAVAGSFFPVSAVFPADVDWTISGQLGLKAPPLDISASADGKWLYILCPGEIVVYSFNEDKIIKRIPIAKAVDKMIYVKEKNAAAQAIRYGSFSLR